LEPKESIDAISECKFALQDVHTKITADFMKGLLICTSTDRILFVVKKGSFRKKVEVIDHWFPLERIANCYKGYYESQELVLFVEGPDSFRQNFLCYVLPDVQSFEYWDNLIMSGSYLVWKFRHPEIMEQICKRAISRERVSFDEFRDLIYASRDSRMRWRWQLDDSAIIKDLESMISSKRIHGIINEKSREFVNIEAYRKEKIQYNISFELGSDGVKINCPHCGNAKLQKEKSSQVVCSYCGNSFVIPSKILDLI